MSVAEYMTICLLDPVYGYYPTRDPLGSDGDFITAPEISQMFGEVIGLWALQSWIDMGRPSRLILAELGPGRGVMMSDIVRAARTAPDFLDAIDIVLLEASAALEAVQAETLKDSPVPVRWVNRIEDLPLGPALIIGNEFLDCLPIRQFIQKDSAAGRAGWHERLVTAQSHQSDFEFALSPEPISEVVQASLPSGESRAKQEDLLEVCPAMAQLVDYLSSRFSAQLGRALFIDYGPAQTEFGDTLQALRRHEKVGVFSDPGNTDLTARVDFSAMLEFALHQGLMHFGPVAQSDFLSKLGIELRAASLSRARPESRAKIARQLTRLMDEDQMGSLFKVVAFQSDNLPMPLGF